MTNKQVAEELWAIDKQLYGVITVILSPENIPVVEMLYKVRKKVVALSRYFIPPLMGAEALRFQGTNAKAHSPEYVTE